MTWIHEHSSRTAVLICMSSVSLKGEAQLNLELADRKILTEGINLVLAELWVERRHHSRWTWSSPPDEWWCEIFTSLLMTKHNFFAWVSTAHSSTHTSTVYLIYLNPHGAGQWSMQNLSPKKSHSSAVGSSLIAAMQGVDHRPGRHGPNPSIHAR